LWGGTDNAFRGEMLFRDRSDAGRRLAEALAKYKSEAPIVLGLPRGGVPVAFEIARTLGAPLDVWVVRKLGVPIQPEFGMGAIAEGGGFYLDRDTLQLFAIGQDDVTAVAEREGRELERRVRLFRAGRPLPDLLDRTVIVVDDGVATGGTARAAIQAIRAQSPKRIVLALPVGAPNTVEELRRMVDDLVCLQTPAPFRAIGVWYADFKQTTDDHVLALLQLAGHPASTKTRVVDKPQEDGTDEEVVLDLGQIELAGRVTIPRGAKGLVIFAHGSGSSRLSPRNQQVAATLRREGLGTLLFDLLTEEEAKGDTTDLRFDIDLLAERLAAATRWAANESACETLRRGYFGASTGAAAALSAAARNPGIVSAIVSRGGRPDLAGRWLPQVLAPTLLIVGGNDPEVLRLNQRAFERLPGTKRIEIVPGATHLFEEPGALDEVARLASAWFADNLAGAEDRNAAIPTPGALAVGSSPR
jgi:putative phosphoribosyl transferase